MNPPSPDPSPPSVAQALRELRRQQGLSLDELAQRSGVSRSMLSQIERDTTNPTVATLWRITQALGVSIDEVLGQPDTQPTMERLEAHALPRMNSADGLVSLRVLGPLESAGRHEWYELVAQPGGVLASKPHAAGTHEHLYVVEGEMAVTCRGETQRVQAPALIRYPADVAHELRNAGTQAARAWLTVMGR